MSDDPYKDLLARVEAIAANVTLVLVEARAEHEAARVERRATETLRGQREKKAARQKEWRSGASPTSDSSVSGDATRRVSRDATPVVVDLELKQRDQEQDQKPPARRHKDATPVAATVLAGPQVGPTTPVWNAYEAAYELRHGVAPPDSAKGRSQLKQFLTRVPAQDAPEIAAFFLTHNDALYIRAKHPIDLLLRDAPKLYAEWKLGQQVTGTEAREQERTQANVGGWDRLRRGKNGVV